MPDLGNLSLSSSALTLMRRPAATTSPTLKPVSSSDDIVIADSAEFTALSLVPSISVKTLFNGCSGDQDGRSDCNGSSVSRVLKRSRKKGSSDSKCLEDYVRDWVREKMESGVPQSRCFLPFLVGAKKMVDCLSCHSLIYPGEEVLCSVRSCQGAYHFECVKEKLGVSNMKKIKCPQHACFMCKQKFRWRCIRCLIAFHSECAPWPDEVIPLINQPGRVVCWRHPSNWRLDKKHMVPTSDIEEVFCRLPIPYDHEEFNAELTSKSMTENKLEAPSYVHIKRNIYLVKKKRDYTEGDVGCTNCSMDKCCQDCVCRVQCISCSRACRCPESCTNRPFRREKKIKIVKTEFCGWGVEAAEPINKGDFVIEYVGEVIDDALCEQRLWNMKYRGVQNFYMCEIRKDFTIDATFKGNLSRFLNHSCDPNCLLEKWQVEGETRVGVFAARSVEVGEPLTYDYRFVQFGPEVKCYCGSLNCQGFLGTRRRMAKLNICWGAKRRRSSLPCLAIVAV